MAPAKSKAQKMSIGTFLADETYGSWADEMEDNPIPSVSSYAPRSGYGGDRERSTFGTSGGYAQEHHDCGYSVREELPMPTQPPYTAHIGNLSFDATQAGIQELFAECEVTSVRIVEDKLTGSPKGFGYVEFASVDGLKKALTFQGTSLQGRNIRVSIAEPPKDRHDGRDLSDWTRKGPLPDLPGQRRVSDRPGFGGARNFDPASDAANERPGRRGYEAANDGRSRDFSNWERKGPLSPSLQSAPSREGRPHSKDGPQIRRASPAWGEGRSQDGSRPPRREFTERPAPERAPTAPELDNQWRARMRPDAPAQPETPVEPVTPTAAAAAPVPGARPRLNLQKRTIPESEATAPSPAVAEAQSSIFGGAKPIDTASREKEVAEKRELALLQKKEADEKAKAERLEKQKAEKAAKEEAEKAEANGTKEDTTEGKPVEILKREEGEEKAADESEKTAEKVAEKAAAPTQKTEAGKDKGRPPLQSRTSSGWRNGGGRGRGGPPHSRGGSRSTSQRGPPAQGTPSETASPASPATPDEDGWSTVSAKQKNPRRGNYNRGGQAS